MLFRVAIVTETLDERAARIRDAFQAYSRDIGVQVLRRSTRKQHETNPASAAKRVGKVPGSTLAALLAYRPHLVICRNTGPMSLQAATFRRLSRRSRLLLCGGTEPVFDGFAARVIRKAADAILTEDDPVAQAVEQLRLPSPFLTPNAVSTELEPFFACSRTRSDDQARRIVFAGDLSPQSGAADLMIAVATWAERNPSRAVELWWVGEGDLAGVLDAQPLPPGVTQRFLGRLQPQAMAAIFAQCGLLAVPSLVDDRQSAVVEALATGLPVLGCRLDRNVRRWVEDGVNGWLFNALKPEETTRALSRALDSSLVALEQMRDRAQATVRPVARSGMTERFVRALAAAPAEFPSKILTQAAP